jgi:hypothetical protein
MHLAEDMTEEIIFYSFHYEIKKISSILNLKQDFQENSKKRNTRFKFQEYLYV